MAVCDARSTLTFHPQSSAAALARPAECRRMCWPDRIGAYRELSPVSVLTVDVTNSRYGYH